MKTVVITGVSRGIGRATAEKFLKEGWRVIGTSTSGTAPWSAEHLNVVQLELSDPTSIERATTEISLHKPIDVLINNSGAWSELEEQNGDTEKLIVEALRETLEVNLIGTIDFTERILAAVGEGGQVITLGSRMGSLTDTVGRYAPSYSISKAGLSMYTRKLAVRLRPLGITVSIVDPGWVQTDMGGEHAPRKVAEPAEEIYDLATSPHETGQFWYKGKVRSW